MNAPWAIRLAREDAAALAALRLVPNLEIAEDGATIWLRSKTTDENLAAKLAGLPARERYEWLPSNALRATDKRIPSAQLPNVRWQPITEWLSVAAPTAALPGIFGVAPDRGCVGGEGTSRSAPENSGGFDLPQGFPNLQPSKCSPGRSEAVTGNLQPLTLVRSSAEHEPELLLTTLQELARFAEIAAQVRLACLQFAANSDGSVLVRGRPLPPLPGKRFVLCGAIAVAAGYSWQPAVSAEVLASRFGVSGEALILWSEDGTFTRLHSEQFVPASRSAVRATAAASDGARTSVRSNVLPQTRGLEF